MIIAVVCESYVFGCKCMKKIFSYIAKSMIFLCFRLQKNVYFAFSISKARFCIVFCRRTRLILSLLLLKREPRSISSPWGCWHSRWPVRRTMLSSRRRWWSRRRWCVRPQDRSRMNWRRIRSSHPSRSVALWGCSLHCVVFFFRWVLSIVEIRAEGVVCALIVYDGRDEVGKAVVLTQVDAAIDVSVVLWPEVHVVLHFNHWERLAGIICCKSL